MFSNTKIRALLSWGFGIIISLVLIMAVVVYERSSAVSSHITEVTQDAYTKMMAAEIIRINVIRNWANTLLLLQINSPDDSKRITDEMAANSKVITTQFDFLGKANASETEKKHLSTMLKAREDYTNNRKQYLELIKAGNKMEADNFLTGTLKGKLEDYVKTISELIDYQSAHMASLSAETVDLAANLKMIIVALSILVVLVAITTAVIVVRVIGNALGGEVSYANDIARQIAAGNLGVDMHTTPGDSTSLLASLKAMRDQLRNMVSSIGNSSTQVGQAARDLAQASQSVANSSEKQSEATSAAAAAIEEMTVSISQIADNTNEAHTLTVNAEALSHKSSMVIHSAATEMGKIADSVGASSAIISTLEQQSNEISAVINVIKDIADQTNLLALNAAIEAARAGEQGRGFAVVADEVRKLADRTKQSTNVIATTIEKIQGSTKDAVQSMASSVEQVSSGAALAQQAGSSIEDMESGARRVAGVVNNITDSLKEQTAASTEIARDIENIASMVEENNAAAADAAIAAQKLGQLADELSRSVGSFRL
jgi:methyl-accepting chemotaxis protein